MKKIYLITVVFMTLSSFVVMDTYKTSGGHPMSTGAPGENTCADAVTGCHADAKVTKDSSNAVVSIIFPTLDSTYKPGSKYAISLKSFKTGIKKFGFEIVALTKKDNANIGTWTITDATNTQIISGTGGLSARKYITHKTSGTAPVSSGLGQWTFNWTAPSANVGLITFYFITNCTNNDNKVSGDDLYMSSFTIRPEATGSAAAITDVSKFKVGYNASSKSITIQYKVKQTATAAICIYDLNGKTIKSVDKVEKNPGFYSDEFQINDDFPKGIYLVNFSIGGQNLTQKVLVN